MKSLTSGTPSGTNPEGTVVPSGTRPHVALIGSPSEVSVLKVVVTTRPVLKNAEASLTTKNSIATVSASFVESL